MTPVNLLRAQSTPSETENTSHTSTPLTTTTPPQSYTTLSGDTLSLIAKKLLGHTQYWKNLWKMNQSIIQNPNQIQPGLILTWLPIEKVSKQKTFSKNTPLSEKPKKRSQEWKQLPPQSWETIPFVLPPEIDPFGFDQRNKVDFKNHRHQFNPQAIVSTKKIPFLGQIIGASTESQFLFPSEMIYLKSDENLQLGEIYTVTDQPYLLKSYDSGRIGYSYAVLGKVKILGIQDEVFIGEILSARDTLNRGHSLIQNFPAIETLKPIVSTKPVTGTVLLDPRFSIDISVQNKEVMIDRGTEDGIQPGMIFRVYQYYDHLNHKKITDSHLIINADIQVMQVSEKFCSGIILHNQNPIAHQSEAILLTDISHFSKHKPLSNPEQGLPPSIHPKASLNELDALDDFKELGEQEKRELEQLEAWKDNRSQKSEDTSLDHDASSILISDSTIPEAAVPPTAESSPVPIESLSPQPAETSNPSQTDPQPPEEVANEFNSASSEPLPTVESTLTDPKP